MPSGSEIKAPLVFGGVPIKGRINPFLIVIASFQCEGLIVPYWWDRFKELVKEATGFPSKQVRVPSCMPISAQYIFASTEALSDIARVVSLKPDEIPQISEMLDEAMFGKAILKGLRLSQEKGRSLLFREGEDPVYLDLPTLRVRSLAYFPLEEIENADSSVIHLAGTTPIKMAESLDSNSIQMENGLWNSLYGLPLPRATRWKWIWDLEWASLIEYSS